MTLKSKRSILAILSGMAVCLLFATLNRVTWLAPIFGIVTTLYIAKASTAKEGALLGALVPIPSGIYVAVLSVISARQTTGHTINYGSLFLGVIVGCLFLMLAGAMLGALLAIAIRYINKNQPSR